MHKHVSLVVILNLVYRSLSFFGGLVLTGLAIFFDRLMEFVGHWGHDGMRDIPPPILSIVPIVLSAIGIYILLVSTAGIIGAIGLQRKKEWGRILLLVVSFFTLLSIPLGTLLGAYTIWVLFSDETIRMCNPEVAVPAAPAAQR
jgi:hypothetical protein